MIKTKKTKSKPDKSWYLKIDDKKYKLIGASNGSNQYFYEDNGPGSHSTVITIYHLEDKEGERYRLEEPRNGDKKLFAFFKIDKNGKEIKKLKFKKLQSTYDVLLKIYDKEDKENNKAA